MNNHIHLIWQVLPGKTPAQVQHSFMKYTAQQIKFDLVENHPEVLDKFRVNAKDRTYPRLTGRAGILGAEFIGH